MEDINRFAEVVEKVPFHKDPIDIDSNAIASPSGDKIPVIGTIDFDTHRIEMIAQFKRDVDRSCTLDGSFTDDIRETPDTEGERVTILPQDNNTG